MNEPLIYQIERREVRNISIRIHRDGSVWVTAHPLVPQAVIERFVISKREWIMTARQRLKNREQILDRDGQVFVFGRLLPIVVRKGNKKVTAAEVITIYCEDPQDQTLTDRYLNEYLLRLLKQQVEAFRPVYDRLINDYHQLPPTIVYRRMTSRWGTCQFRKGRIIMNTTLVHYPPECLRYVLLHEYMHLIVPNHSRRFHELMQFHMPEYKHYRDILNSGRFDDHH